MATQTMSVLLLSLVMCALVSAAPSSMNTTIDTSTAAVTVPSTISTVPITTMNTTVLPPITTSATGTNTTTTAGPQSPLCADRADGFYPLTNTTSNKTMCKKWTLCVRGNAVTMDCPTGNVFSPEKNQCMLKGLAHKPCGALPSGEPIKPLCVGRKDGELLKALIDPAGSCSLYYKCMNKVATNQTCSAGLAFDLKKQACVDASKVDGCAPPSAINLPKFCSSQKGNGLYADPASCLRAIVCVGDSAFYYTCTTPGRPFFSVDSLSCVADAKKCHLA